MDTIGVVVNLTKKNVVDLVQNIVEWFQTKKLTVIMPENTATALGYPALGRHRTAFVEEADCIMVLGGDGTLLNSARLAAPHGKPVFGLNLGHLGFLTELDIPELNRGLERLLQGQYYIEERMLLEARVLRQGQVMDTAIGLNDAVITKGGFARLIKLSIYVNDMYVGSHPSDGVIVASPTGSTAYSLSAGGPIVTPDLDLMLITPICPHSLRSRPMVISGDSKVRVDIKSSVEDAMFTMDGQYGFKLHKDDSVLVQKAPYRAKFLRLKKHNFFFVLREKLSEGDRNA